MRFNAIKYAIAIALLFAPIPALASAVNEGIQIGYGGDYDESVVISRDEAGVLSFTDAQAGPVTLKSLAVKANENIEDLSTAGDFGTAPVSGGSGALTMIDVATQAELDAIATGDCLTTTALVNALLTLYPNLDTDDTDDLTSLTAEADPVYSASAAATISTSDVSNWNDYVDSNVWSTSSIYDGETRTNQHVTIARAYTGGDNRLFIQGYSSTSAHSSVALDMDDQDDTYVDAHIFTNITPWDTTAYKRIFFDNDNASGSHVAYMAAGTYWLAYLFDEETVVNKVILTHWYTNYWLPWTTVTIYGSNDSTDGSDGTWTALSSATTPGSPKTLEVEFIANSTAYMWIKASGALDTAGYKSISEMSIYEYAPEAAESFYVDAEGNPGTDGTMTISGEYVELPGGIRNYGAVSSWPAANAVGDQCTSTTGRPYWWDGSSWTAE